MRSYTFVFYISLILVSCKNEFNVLSKTSSETTSSTVTEEIVSTTASAKSTISSPKPLRNRIEEPIKPNIPATQMSFEESVYDFGKIKEGEVIEHIFPFKNTGSKDLIIEEATATCGCTVPQWPKQAIKPGQSGEIKVVFNSKNKGQAMNVIQNSKVTIIANTDPFPMVLTLKGIINK